MSSFTPSLSSNNSTALDCVRIRTFNQDFYLKYRTRIINDTTPQWLPFVVSNDTNTSSSGYYAGISNEPIYNIEIQVWTSNNTRVYDDYVVMYRAKVNGTWLDWVSNGNPNAMLTIKQEFNLSGNLDTVATDAGWLSQGAIQNLEIRFFKRIEDNSSQSGSTSTAIEDFERIQASSTSGLSFEYLIGNNSIISNWHSFNGLLSNSLQGIKIKTSSDLPFYFKYRARNGQYYGWLDFVDSRYSSGTGDDNYAGISNINMTDLEIWVYDEDDNRIFEDYIVMYRVKTAGGWLDWVSNGSPEIMSKIQQQFSTEILGNLDTVCTFAGDGNTITQLQILVFRNCELDDTIPSDATIIENVPYINQNSVGMPNGCESVSAVMALKYNLPFNNSITTESFVSNYLDMGPTPIVGGIGPDPNSVFAGNPRLSTGWGCYPPVIVNALEKFIGNYGLSASQLSYDSTASDLDLDSLWTTYIGNDIPIILWVTVSMTNNFQYRYWYTPQGTQIEYNNKLHCVLLVGYDNNNKIDEGYPFFSGSCT